ncbi:MAG: glutamate--tRNA ligase [Candidatus Ancillula sp.]|jgi:glutamyl-tRNA synthetase|nr:glutamate--tRNA ligase [Candidatus Ancillula sp.]
MSEVRVRFCPSPTGTPHVGLVRSCLFNYVYAKHAKGKFIFRIEDTDASRDSEDSYTMIIDALRWLGLNWDEGIEVGGPHEPYRQSQRMDKYAEVVDRLLEAGYAYKSFSTKDEIDARNKANGRPVQMGYDNFDRNLSSEEVAAFEAEGRECSIRVKMPESDIIVQDLVRGEVVFKARTIPDYVIVRGNGQPLYTLVNPVDDALMEINCVLRGEDLLSSTPRQIALYNYLIELGIAKEVPQFGHLPYVMGEGNKKLSKRDPESNLFLHRENGMIPEGLVNYLGLLGWSVAADRDLFQIDEMIEKFEPTDVLANPARFDLKKCTAINADHIRMLEPDDFKRRLVPYLHGSVSKKYVDMPLLKEITDADPDLPHLKVYPPLVSADTFEKLTAKEQEILTKAAPLIQERIQLLNECREMLSFLFSEAPAVAVEPDAQKQLEKVNGYREVLDRALEVLENVDEQDWTAGNLHEVLQKALSISPEGEPDYPNSLNLKPRDAFTPLRIAISGRRVSPPLFECLEILGKPLSIARVNALKEAS